ncbi:MAG: LytTR family DNA-binding domain-containing protein, partial [Gemmatimonadales bacterium]
MIGLIAGDELPERHRVLVVDDEPLARTALREWRARTIDPPDVLEVSDAPAAIEAIGRWRPDLVLLDVQMPGMDGFGVIRRVGVEAMPVTVFVTAHDSHAVRAFRVHALDYLLKPLDEEELLAVYNRARKRWTERAELEVLQRLRWLLRAGPVPAQTAPAGDAASIDDADEASAPLDHLAVPVREGVRLVAAESVDWLEAADDYVYVHTAGRAHLVRQRLGFYERRLDGRRFVRIHRSTIVNLARVSGFVQDAYGA